MGLLLGHVGDTRTRGRNLRTTRTLGNVNTQNDDFSPFYGSQIQGGYGAWASFTGPTGPDTIVLVPSTGSSTQTAIDPPTYTGSRWSGWRDPESEFPVGPAEFVAGTWALNLRVGRSAQDVAADVRVRVTAILSEIPANKSVGTLELVRFTFPDTTVSGTIINLYTTVQKAAFRVRRNSRLHLEIYVQNINPATGTVAPPGAKYDLDLYLNQSESQHYKALSSFERMPTWFYPVQPTGGADLSGNGTLSFIGRPGFPSGIALTGDGTLAATGTPGFINTAQFSGEGTLSGTGIRGGVGLASLSGEGTLSGLQTRATISGTVALSGEGSLSGTGRPGFPATIARTGSGTLAATGIRGVFGTLALSGSGVLAGTPTFVTVDEVSLNLTGDGTLSGIPRPEAYGVLALDGEGTLSGTGVQVEHGVGEAQLAGSGTLSASGLPNARGSINLSGSGTLVPSGRPGGVRTVAFTGSGTLSFPSPLPAVVGTATLTGSGTLGIVGRPGFGFALALTGSGTLVPSGRPGGVRTIALTGSGTVVMGLLRVGFVRTVALSGSGVLLSRSALFYVRARSPNTGQMVRAFVKVRFAYNLPWIRCRIKVRHPQEPTVWIELDNTPPKMHLSGSGQLVGERALIEPLPVV